MTIKIHTPEEIEHMRVACRFAAELLDYIGPHIVPGITTNEIDRLCEEYTSSRGSVSAPLNYAPPGHTPYPKSICTSVNQQVVHGIPGRYRLKDGDILSLDVGARLHGFHGDAARTILIGQVPQEIQKLVAVTKECFFEGLKEARPGKRIADISKAIQGHAESHGYGVVRELIGHGIGRDLHEQPDVPNFWDDHAFGHGVRLQAGMTIAIEPMINLGTAEVARLSDGWTVVTDDGKPSAHYENTIAITDGEPVLLTLHEEETA